MTDREKLIQILSEDKAYPNCAECKKPVGHCNRCTLELHADHLIANGVIVLPCKLGETVYVIRDCSCYGRDWMDGSRSKCKEKVYLGKKRRAHHCGYVSEATFELKHFADFGKKVFLTKEEAETALAKMAGGADDGK